MGILDFIKFFTSKKNNRSIYTTNLQDRSTYAQSCTKTLKDKTSERNVTSAIIPYDEYDRYLKNIDPLNLDLSDVEPKELTSVEKSFLRYIDGRETKHLSISREWYYTYSLDVLSSIKIFLKSNLITVSKYVKLDFLTVDELKKLLAYKGLVKSGNKQQLIDRIANNFTKDEINEVLNIDTTFYRLTERGKRILENYPISATCNIDLEDFCISNILEGKYDTAYNAVCNFRKSAPLSCGLGFDWNAAQSNGWNGKKLDCTNEKLKYYSACEIFCSMMGLGYKKVDKLFFRLTGQKFTLLNDEKTDMKIEQYKFYQSNKNELDEYKRNGVKQYQILAMCDNKTCKHCAHMDNKIFNVSDAVIGVNAPPFEYSCRCTTIALSNVPTTTTRRARDKDGKAILIPSDMNYEAWSKKYSPEKYKEYFCD